MIVLPYPTYTSPAYKLNPRLHRYTMEATNDPAYFISDDICMTWRTAMSMIIDPNENIIQNGFGLISRNDANGSDTMITIVPTTKRVANFPQFSITSWEPLKYLVYVDMLPNNPSSSILLINKKNAIIEEFYIIEICVSVLDDGRFFVHLG